MGSGLSSSLPTSTSPAIAALGYLAFIILFRWNTMECRPDKQTFKVFPIFHEWGGWEMDKDRCEDIAFTDVDMKGKTVVVTGSNTGIGFQTARELARMGATVILACRTPAKAEKAVEDIVEATASRTVSWLQLDLTDTDSIRNFTKNLKEKCGQDGFDVLINNAGMLRHERKVTKEGQEMTLAANHLGPFLLTHLLLDDLKKKKGARIVNVNSSLHHLPKCFDFKDPQMEKNYEMFSAYGRAKLAAVQCTYELQRRMVEEKADVTVNCLHPGQVMTDVSKNMHWILRYGELMFYPLMYLMRKTAYQGCFTSVHVATSPDLAAVGGKYFVNCREARSNPSSYNKEEAKKVWELSCKLVGIHR